MAVHLGGDCPLTGGNSVASTLWMKSVQVTGLLLDKSGLTVGEYETN
jgi:hypothetical protein